MNEPKYCRPAIASKQQWAGWNWGYGNKSNTIMFQVVWYYNLCIRLILANNKKSSSVKFDPQYNAVGWIWLHVQIRPMRHKKMTMAFEICQICPVLCIYCCMALMFELKREKKEKCRGGKGIIYSCFINITAIKKRFLVSKKYNCSFVVFCYRGRTSNAPLAVINTQ